MYDGYNDEIIYHINRKLHHLAVVNEGIKYLDVNSYFCKQGDEQNSTLEWTNKRLPAELPKH